MQLEKELSRFPAFPWIAIAVFLVAAVPAEYWLELGGFVGIAAIWMASVNLITWVLTVRIFTDGKSFLIRKGRRESVFSASEIVDVEKALIHPFMILRVGTSRDSEIAYTFLPQTNYSAWSDRYALYGADVIEEVAKICGWHSR